jgi:HAD superfamily hydrolase (TIGR01509 family)
MTQNTNSNPTDSRPAESQACIFDLDGLMINTEQLAFDTYALVLRQYGYTLTEEIRLAVLGMDNENTARTIIEITGAPLDTDTLWHTVFARFLTRLDGELQPLPGVLELLAEVARRGKKMAVASNSPSEYAHLAVAAIGAASYFPVLVCRDDVARGKPDPDIYLAAARALATPPAACLGIEDSPVGMRAALSAGMRCAVVNTQHSGLEFAPATACFNSLIELQADLDALLKLP